MNTGVRVPAKCFQLVVGYIEPNMKKRISPIGMALIPIVGGCKFV